jgi:L-ascorbate metabolism protein UlaG (beta-lactamase superfamily)
MTGTVRFLGHAALDVRMGGVRVCIDPHRPGALGGRFQLPEITGAFDAVFSTHRHEDHAGWTPAMGTTLRLDPPATIGALRLSARPAFHDRDGGVRMGLVRMVALHDGAVRLVHLGDLSAWSDADVAWLRGADVVAVPVGGTYTLDGAEAAELCRRIGPRVAIPVHACDARIDLPLQPVAPFLEALGWPVVRLPVLDLAALPSAGTIVILAAP